jgi:hypothetical protein
MKYIVEFFNVDEDEKVLLLREAGETEDVSNIKELMDSVQQIYGPCRGKRSDGSYRFLTNEGILVYLKIV